MSRSKPQPDPLPSVGGTYLLDEQTGRWILQELAEQPPVSDDDGTDS